jgi:hypothetical protein
VNKNLKTFLLTGFLSYYVFFVLFGWIVEQCGKYADGYQAFEIALFFGPFVALAFVGILYLAVFSRRNRLPAASISVVTIGAAISAFLGMCCFAVIDLSISEAIDQQFVGAIGDWIVPAAALVLTFIVSYIGARIATKDA